MRISSFFFFFPIGLFGQDIITHEQLHGILDAEEFQIYFAAYDIDKEELSIKTEHLKAPEKAIADSVALLMVRADIKWLESGYPEYYDIYLWVRYNWERYVDGKYIDFTTLPEYEPSKITCEGFMNYKVKRALIDER